MGSGRETETANNHFYHPTGLSLSSMKKDDDRCKRNCKNNSIVKSLSSYSTCTEGEKYFTSPKGHHYFYTRTGNKHLLVPTENVLKGRKVILKSYHYRIPRFRLNIEMNENYFTICL